MIKISYGNSKRYSEFLIEKVKYIHFKTNEDYWLFKQSLNKEIRKIQSSEYAEEINKQYFIKIDDEKIAKDTEVLTVNSEFDIDEDMKMGSKSLMMRYLCFKISNKDHFDLVNQANLCLSLLSDDISEEGIIIKNRNLDSKTISKIFEASMIKDEQFINGIDLSYEEIIEYQLKLILNSYDGTKRLLVCVETRILTENIRSYIDKLPKNIYILIVFNETEIELLEDNVYIDGIDFQDEEGIYERMKKQTNFYNLNKYKEKLNNLKNVYYLYKDQKQIY